MQSLNEKFGITAAEATTNVDGQVSALKAEHDKVIQHLVDYLAKSDLRDTNIGAKLDEHATAVKAQEGEVKSMEDKLRSWCLNRETAFAADV